MKTRRFLLLCLMFPVFLAACQGKPDNATSTTGFASIQLQMDKQDIKLNARGYPDARITPEGNLVIGDSVVEITGEQHGLLTQYRGQVAAIAQQGAQMGVQGAAVAAATAKAVIGAVFSGDTDQVEAKVKAETDKIKEHVGVLCGHLAELKQTQDTLAAQLPAFAPYAHIDQDDIDDCNSR